MKLLTSNFGWKVLSLGLAVVLWMAVAHEPELATSISVPIEFKNLREDLDISSDVPDRVHIEVRGPSGRLTRDQLADVAVLLDMSDVQRGERTFTIRNANVKLPAGVEFYRAVPSQVSLVFDQLTSRVVPVQPRFGKEPPAGYRVQSFEADPVRVRIRGPEDRVNRIDHVTTDPVDLSGIVSKADVRAHVHIGDSQVRLDEPTGQITVHVSLQKTPSRVLP
ncbi:MAG: CdaR family protein [Acidobacteriota bacterium]|nr:CdaR family protein [Acidobacteriota bacterium]